MRFESWCHWMLWASVFFTVFGVVAAVAPHSGLFGFWIDEIDRAVT